MELFDVHCHILPDVDDGSASWADLKKLFKCYRSCAISTIIFTPHLYNPYVRTNVSNIRIAYKRAKEMAMEEGLKVSLASEVFVLDKEVVKGIPILGQYMLIEFPLEYAPPKLEEKLRSIPFRPIIAHIERYRWLTPDSPFLETMKEIGCLFQVNGKGLKKSEVAKEYVRRGLVDLIASDCHGAESDIIDLAETLSSQMNIMTKMSQMGHHLKEVVNATEHDY